MFFTITFVLPALFIVTALVGGLLLANAVIALLAKRAYVPDAKGLTGNTLRTVESGKVRKIGVLSIILGAVFLIVSAAGLKMIYDFKTSPAVVRYMIPPPDGYEILYSTGSIRDCEIAYGLETDMEKAQRHFLDGLREDGWGILRETPISVVASRDGEHVTLSFIGFQKGDEKTHRSKVILIYRQDR